MSTVGASPDRDRHCSIVAAVEGGTDPAADPSGPAGGGAAARGGWVAGSGYLIGERLVLTAGHTVPVDEAVVEVAGRSVRARRIWTGLGSRADGSGLDGSDAALLEIHDDTWRPPVLRRLRWGRATGTAPVACAAVGYPGSAQVGGLRGPEAMTGSFNPAAEVLATPFGFQPLHQISVDGSVPVTDPGRPTWAGASGAGVVCGDGILTGVLTGELLNYGHDRLAMVPVAHLLTLDGFVEALAAAGVDRPDLVPIELAPWFRDRPEEPPQSPGALLIAANGVVAFRGRDGELDDLERWCDAEPRFAARLLHGPGGQGKTRLATELIGRRRRQGWIAGELDRDLDRSLVEGFAGAAADLLFVLDYAETASHDTVTRLIERLKATAAGRFRIRLLLIARGDGPWWTTLRRTTNLPDGTTLALQPLDPTVERRTESFRLAVADLARHLDELDSPVPALRCGAPGGWTSLVDAVTQPDLAAPRYDTVLDIHMLALVALLQLGPDRVDAAGVDRVEDVLLSYEERYWEQYWRNGGGEVPSNEAMRRAVAAATLYRPADRRSGEDLLAGVRGWTGSDGGETQLRERACRWLHETYPPPGEGHWGGLEPDPLGEHLVGRVLLEDPELVSGLLPGLDRVAAERGLVLLARVVPSFPDVEGLVAGTVADHPRPLLVPALAAALQAEHPECLARALSAGLAALDHSGDDDLPIVAALMASLPAVPGVLAAVAARTAAMLVAHHEAAGDPTTAADASQLIAALRELCLRHGVAGDPEAGLAAGDRAAALFATASGFDPPVDPVELALVEQARSFVLLRLQRYAEAEEAGRSAARSMERGGGPGGTDRMWAISSRTLLAQAVAMGNGSAAGEALALLRVAAEAADGLDDVAGDPLANDLALMIRAEVHTASGLVTLNGGDAAGAATELEAGCTLLREVVERHPALASATLGVAVGLLGWCRYVLDGFDRAAVCFGEAIPHIEPLAGDDPGMQTMLAVFDEYHGDCLVRLGQPDAAITHIDRAVATRRSRDEGGAERGGELLTVLIDQVDCLELLGRAERMLAAADEAVALAERLAADDVGTHLPRVVRLRLDRAAALAELERQAEGLEALRQVLTFDSGPAGPAMSTRLRFQLSRAHFLTGFAELQAGDLPAGIERYRRAAELAGGIVSEDGSNREHWLRILVQLANLHALDGDAGSARPLAEQAATLARELDDGATLALDLATQPQAILAMCAVIEGRVGDAGRLIDGAVERARAHPLTPADTLTLIDLLNRRAAIGLEAGLAGQALADAREASGLFRMQERSVFTEGLTAMMTGEVHANLALASARAGRPEEALDAVDVILDRFATMARIGEAVDRIGRVALLACHEVLNVDGWEDEAWSRLIRLVLTWSPTAPLDVEPLAREIADVMDGGAGGPAAAAVLASLAVFALRRGAPLDAGDLVARSRAALAGPDDGSGGGVGLVGEVERVLDLVEAGPDGGT